MPRAHRLPLRVVLTLLLSAAVAAAGATSAHASSTQVTILQDDGHVLADPVGTMETLRSLGVTDVRIFLPWGKIAPDPLSRTRPSGFNATDPGAYPAGGWLPYDTAVQVAHQFGIGVYFDFLGPAPLWAATRPPHGSPTRNASVYEPSAHQFGDFVRAVGRRYSGSYTPSGSLSGALPRVSFWGIWNEPNYGPDLQPQVIHGVEVAPAVYRELLGAAWSALHATGHGHDTILIGETAPRGVNNPGVISGMLPLRFLRNLYCVDSSLRELRGSAASARGCPRSAGASRRFRAQNPALFKASFAGHLYTSGQVARPDIASPSFEPDYAGLSDLPRLETTLNHLLRVYGSHKKLPIYNTEFGFQTNPPRHKCGCVFISPSTAAYYMNWSEFLIWHDPRVSSDSQYLLYDGAVPGHPDQSDFASGLLFSTGTPKNGYDAFRLPLYLPVTSTQRGRSLEVWGGVRPAPYAQNDTGASQQALIQFRPSGGSWTTVQTVTLHNSRVYFDKRIVFPSSGFVRLEWTYPSAFAFLPPTTAASTVETSRIQKIKVR